jgi:mRNA-degrading endonuclease RelE of RelBE toxin-antitoxin system
VTLTVVFREAAVRNLARIRSEDKDLFVRTRQAIAALADEPYPQGAVAWGATGIYRLHAGAIRVLYEGQ